MENLKSVITEVVSKALPAIAGFILGVPVGGALIWWVFL